MSKVKIITIKHKQSGMVRGLGEPEFNNMIDKSDWEITTSKKSDEDDRPDMDWTMSEIKSYFDANNVSYTTTQNTKAKLLALIE